MLKFYSSGKEKGIAVEENKLKWDKEIKGENHALDEKNCNRLLTFLQQVKNNPGRQQGGKHEGK